MAVEVCAPTNDSKALICRNNERTILNFILKAKIEIARLFDASFTKFMQEFLYIIECEFLESHQMTTPSKI